MVKLDNKKIREYLAHSDSGPDKTKQGKRLEDLMCYIFGPIVGVKLERRNVYDTYYDQEIDLVFSNDFMRSDLCFLLYLIAFECKNWSEPVSKNDVILFAKKLRNKGFTVGILVTQSGITGNESNRAYAYGEIQRTLLSDGSKIIVITGKDLVNVTDTDQIVAMLREKLLRLVIPLNVR